MGSITKWLLDRLSPSYSSAKPLQKEIYAITKLRPRNLALYQLALQHGSLSKTEDSNERLEFLGDAVLSLIVAEYLFKKYPNKGEGFLTEIRARLVNRSSLGKLAKQIGIDALLQYNRSAIRSGFKYIYGNALEALVGAVYLDRGYQHCSTFVVEQLLQQYVDLEEVVQNNTNYKSQLLEWANKHHQKVLFQIIDEQNFKGMKEFTAEVIIGEATAGQGKGRSKYQAELQAAHSALETMGYPLAFSKD